MKTLPCADFLDFLVLVRADMTGDYMARGGILESTEPSGGHLYLVISYPRDIGVFACLER